VRGPGRTVPAGISRPALSLGAVAFALFGIARTTGSGWLIVILTGIASVVALAAVLPWFGLRRVRLTVEAPRDATVGRTAEIAVEVTSTSTPVKLRVLDLDGSWTGALPPCRGLLAAAPRRRGVVEALTVEVRSAAPLGLVWWRRRIPVELARPMEVGPRPTDVTQRVPEGREQDGREALQATSTLADAVKTVREYVAGDPIKLVHWAATARSGELMVKELESPVAPALVIAVDLRGGGDDDVEGAASRAAGLALAGLRQGLPVVLMTAERSGPRIGPVGSNVEVGRRLARAVAGALPVPPRGTEPVVIRASSTESRS
jgi:uncharacterized protein (DUF58 family)